LAKVREFMAGKEGMFAENTSGCWPLAAQRSQEPEPDPRMSLLTPEAAVKDFKLESSLMRGTPWDSGLAG
jgi:hypothetical protein